MRFQMQSVKRLLREKGTLVFNTQSTATELTKGFRIPSKPEILLEVEQCSADPDYQLTDVAEIVTKDPALSSSVLQVVNSAANGLNRSISDISQAVCFLGVEQVKAIIAIYRMREEYGRGLGIKMERFWDETAETANMMMFINKWLGNKVAPDTLYSFGLFHDCGIAAMAFKFDDYLQTLQEANDDPDKQLFQIEHLKYKTDHPTVGYYITSSWHLPKSLCKMVRFHHDLDMVSEHFSAEEKASIALLHLAEYFLRSTKRFEENAWFEKHKGSFLA